MNSIVKTEEKRWNMLRRKEKKTQLKLTLKLEEISHKILAKERRLKKYRYRIKQYRQNKIFQNNKRNSTNKKRENARNKPIARCKGSKTILEQNMGTKRTSQKCRIIKQHKELEGSEEGHRGEIHVDSSRATL